MKAGGAGGGSSPAERARRVSTTLASCFFSSEGGGRLLDLIGLSPGVGQPDAEPPRRPYQRVGEDEGSLPSLEVAPTTPSESAVS